MRSILGALIAAFAGIVFGQSPASFPTRPVSIIVPGTPGSGSDIIARILADRMRQSLGQPVIVENIPGANGNIGTAKVARAAPDGYTIVLGVWNTHVSNAALYPLTFDVVKDFEPIAQLTEAGRLILTRTSIPANDLPGLIAWMKAQPHPISNGAAMGSMEHIAGALFGTATGTQLQHVPYRGPAPALQALMAGEIDMMITGITESVGYIRAGKLKAYAVTANVRFPAAPEVPTVDEAGLPGLYAAQWTGLWAPKGTPRVIIDRLNAAVVEALSDPGVRARFPEPAVIIPRERQTPEALLAKQRAEIEKWWPVIKAANIKIE